MKTFFKILAGLVIISLVYFAGYVVGHKNVEFEKGYIPKVVNTNIGKPKDIDFSIFWEAWDIVLDRYFGDTDYKKMVYGAVSGMLQSLGDPYTLFMSPEDAKRFDEDLQGHFDGIGAELEAQDGYLVIVSPLEGSPAQKAGIEPKDIIIKIDGQDVPEMSFYEAISKIRGKKGTTVKLEIVRNGFNDSKEFEITRDTIVVESVKYEMKDDIGYLKINQFGDDTLDLVKKGLDFFISKNAKAVIVDLRNNPGGYLQDSVDIAGLFMEKDKIIVIEKGKEGTETIYKTKLNPKMSDKKLIVLVNDGSASASEIFAGAIQDYKRGTIIGIKTFGKGSVQTLETLEGGAQLKVTVAEWLTPEKRQINKKGIEPDIEVKISEEDIKEGRDPQLEKAIEEANK